MLAVPTLCEGMKISLNAYHYNKCVSFAICSKVIISFATYFLSITTLDFFHSKLAIDFF